MAIRIGSWGLPELGLTEAAAGFLSGGKTTDLSNAITNNYSHGGASGGWDAPVTTPKQSVPYASKSTPTPAPSVPTSTPPVSGNSGGPDMNQMINDMYSPAFNALSAIEASQPGLQQTAVSGLENQKSAMQQAYDAMHDKTQTLLGNQATDLFNSQRSGDAANVKQYNAAQQQANSLYGRSSSTGGAVSEIILSEFLRNGGNLRASYASGQKIVQQSQREQDSDFSNKTLQLQKDFGQAVKEVNDTFSQRLQEISLKKATLEQEKTAMRMDALQSAINDAKALEQYKTKAMFDLGVWNTQRQAELGQNQAYLDDLTAKVAAEMKMRESQMQDVTNNSISYNAPTQAPLNFTNPGANYKDPFANLLT